MAGSSNQRALIRLFLGAFVLVAASGAEGQSNRVFVSARSGNDLNSCNSITTPCQSFQGAVNQVAPAGTVIVLDSGGYGPMTITKALTVDSPPGIVAFIHPPTGNAITINAGAGDNVILRGIALNVGDSVGLRVNTAGTVHVENCAINGFSSHGVSFLATGQLFMKDTTVANNTGEGVLIEPASGNATVSMDRCRLDGNSGSGLALANNTSVTIRDSVAVGNFRGFTAGTQVGQTMQLNIERCVSSTNVVGIFAADSATTKVRVSDTVVTGNSLGLQAFGAGTILSRGNNTVEGNGSLQAFTGSYAAK